MCIDGISAPTTGLPYPLKVSEMLHQPDFWLGKDAKNTMMLMQFGQFVDHDISFTPDMNVKDGICCRHPYDLDPPNIDGCFPMLTPDHPDQKCWHFVRSTQHCFNRDWPENVREQFVLDNM